MADNSNVTLNAGTGGKTIAAEECPAGSGNALITRCKIALGAVETDSGDVSSSNPMPISNNPETTFTANGQVTLTTGGTVYQLPSNTVLAGVVVKALVGNADKIYIGNSSGMSTSTGLELAPGDSLTLPVSNSNLIYCVSGTSGVILSWLAV